MGVGQIGTLERDIMTVITTTRTGRMLVVRRTTAERADRGLCADRVISARHAGPTVLRPVWRALTGRRLRRQIVS